MVYNTELQTKYKHLFELYEGEESNFSYYKKGQVLRGIETSYGWNSIIETLLEKIEWIRTNNIYIQNPNYISENDYSQAKYIEGPYHKIKIFQIKEKYGELRCYVSVESNSSYIKLQIEKAISFAEGQASLTCKNCGSLFNNSKDIICLVCNC